MVSEPVGTWTRRVRWDEAGRLLAAWGEGAGAPAGTWAFAYDHNGERLLKYRIEDGQVAGATLYLRDEQGNVLSEMQWVDTGAAGYWARAKDHVYQGRDLIGSFDRGTGEPHVVSYARDHLGSQRAEVWGPDTSTATDLWPYGALARTKAAGGPPALANGAHLFTGHEREYTGSEALADPLMGLDYMHARYYSHTLGRFLSVDPVGGKPGLSQSWNRYAYVRGNPVGAVDPDGRNPLAAVAAAGRVLAYRLLAGALSGGATQTAWDAGIELAKREEAPSLLDIATTVIRKAPRSFPRGAAIGAANAIPGGGGVAAGLIEYHDRRAAGEDAESATEKAILRGGVTTVIALLTLPADEGSNTLETTAGILAGEAVTEGLSFLGNDFPDTVSPPDGSGEQLRDRREQERELLQELDGADEEPRTGGGHE